MTSIQSTEIKRFGEFVSANLGLHFDQDESAHLAEVFLGRLRKTGCDRPAAYWSRLGSITHAHTELREIARELTVGETYFYRHPEQCQAFSDIALRDRLAASHGMRPIRILSAGCASGEEAYSLAAIAHDVLGPSATQAVEVLGIDINVALLEKARRGRYSGWSLRATNEQQKRRHFQSEGHDFILNDAVRDAVRFQERNLLDDDASFWIPGRFDIIFCRNVTIYFALETVKAVIARLAGALCPGGFLFLGSSETLRGISQAFHLRHTHGAFYYQRRHADELPAQSPPPHVLVTHSAPPPQAQPSLNDLSDDSWLGAIDKASQRIAALAQKSQSRSPRDSSAHTPRQATPAPSPAHGWDLAAARELLKQERFADVVEALRSLPPESETDLDVLLLHAVVLTNGGKVEKAEQICLQVLARDEMNAGAHYLRALCREHAGDKHAAVEHDQIASYLDPQFAMPRLHLGLMAQRDGDAETARLQLRQALQLLAKEDAARILLFGGGFHRESLAQLCRSKLQACGGAA